MPRVAVVTDSTASLPAELAQARGIRVVPLQVVIGAQVLRRGPRRCHPRRGRRGAARLRAGQHLAARAGRCSPSSTIARGRRGRGDRVGAPVGRDERHLRVRPAGRARGRAAGARRRLAGRSASRPATPPSPAADVLRRRRDGGGGGAGGARPGPGGHLAVLRRHAGVPPPRRPDRRRRRDPRQRAVGQAAARDRRRHGRAAASRCVRRHGRSPGSRSSPSRRPATQPVDVCVVPPRQRRSRRASSPPRWPSGSPTSWRVAR